MVVATHAIGSDEVSAFKPPQKTVAVATIGLPHTFDGAPFRPLTRIFRRSMAAPMFLEVSKDRCGAEPVLSLDPEIIRAN